MPERVEKGTNRAKAQPFLEGMAARGISANEALRTLREMGLGYRRTDFLADYRTYTGREKAKNVAKYIRKDRYPTQATMVADVRNLKDKYQSHVVYSYIDRRTGEEKTDYLFIGSEKPMMVGEIESVARDVLSNYADTYGVELTGLRYNYTRYRVD
jgi:hypothetical protein